MKERALKITAIILALSTLACGAALGAIAWSIRQSVRENCRIAQRAHSRPGDDVAALMEFMKSPEHSLRDRDHKAIWTLGRLGDPRALPALESAYTGQPCDHDNNLCQYELEKAIRACGGTPAPRRKTEP